MSKKDNQYNNNTENYSCRNIGGGSQKKSVHIDGEGDNNIAAESTHNAPYTKFESAALESNFSSVFLENDIENPHMLNPENTITEAQKTPEEIIAEEKKSAEDEKKRILAEAQAEADRINAEAKSEADRIKAEARAETEAKTKELSAKELELNLRASELERQKNELAAEKEKHTSEFNNMIAQAKALGNNLVKQGQSRKEELIDEGETEKKRLINSVTEEVKQEAKLTVIKELFEAEEGKLEANREKLNNICTEIGNKDSEIKKNVADKAGELSDNINSCFSVSINSLSNHLNELIKIQNDMVSTLDTWQRSLYTTRLNPLCTSFESINRLIETHEGNLASCKANKNVSDNHIKEEVLTPIVKTLITFREQLASALAPFGIARFYPEEGKGFDPNYHSVKDAYKAPDELIDQPITKCIKPGFIKAGYENEPQAVLVKAVVEVETKSPKF